MKKITAVLLSLVMLIGLFGCSGKNTADSGTNISETETEQQGKNPPPVQQTNTAKKEEPQKSQIERPQNDKIQGEKSKEGKLHTGSSLGGKEKPKVTGRYQDGGSEPLENALQGIFVREIESDQEPYINELVDIRIFGGMILLEHALVIRGGSDIYDTWAEEFWADSPGLLSESSGTLKGRSQCYSIMAMAGEFQSFPEPKTLILEGDTLYITEESGEIAEYERTDEKFIHGEPADKLSMLKNSYETETVTEPVGRWLCWSEDITAYLDIRQDGTFTYAAKQPGNTSCVLDGGWVYDRLNGPLAMVAERAGYADMPYEFEINWMVDEGGNLHLQNLSSEGLQPLVNEVIFIPQEGEWTIIPEDRDPFGYVLDRFSTRGSYENDYGIDVSYYYCVPWVIGETSGIKELNEQIYEDIPKRVDEDIERIHSNDFIELMHVDWESSVY